MEYRNILYSSENEVAVITLNRPRVRNAMSSELKDELADALNDIKRQKKVKVLIITGGESVFSAGADIKEMQSSEAAEMLTILEKAGSINDTLEQMQIPVIAAINGPALGGGCELALACDFRVAGENASFGFPEISLGVIPGAGGTLRLTRLIGAAKAKEMIMLGKRINGKEASQIGLVTEVVPDDQVLQAAYRFAEKLKHPSCSAAKAAIQYGSIYGPEAGKKFEQEQFIRCFTALNHAEIQKE